MSTKSHPPQIAAVAVMLTLAVCVAVQAADNPSTDKSSRAVAADADVSTKPADDERERKKPASDRKDKQSDKKSAAKAKNAAGQKTLPVKLSIDQEESALQFVGDHHPELAKLLQQLRKSSPAGFHRGIREIHVTSQRLKRFENQPARFETELRNWKTDSKIRLLTARWAVSSDPKLEKEIQTLLRKRRQSRLKQMKEQRRRVAQQLKNLDKQIGTGTENLDADLATEWERLKKRALASARAGQRSKPGESGDNKSKPSKKTKSGRQPGNSAETSSPQAGASAG